MKRSRETLEGERPLDLIEQATHLLRAAPASTLAAYYLGSIPFVLGLLYFWADMSLSAFAHTRRAEAALLVAVLFLWMKFFHALFAARLRAQASGKTAPRWNLRQAGAVFIEQGIIQPTGLFFIPLAALPVLPLGWVYAFYQNCAALADPDSSTPVTRRAFKQALLWPGQNHTVLLILLLFACAVFLNWTVISLALPSLLKTLLGIETLFSRSPWSMFNPTFFTAMAGLTFLCVDPLIKAVYVLRCFQGESRHSGEDLKAELRQHSVSAKAVFAAVVLSAALFGGDAGAAETTPAPPSQSIQSSTSPADLDRSIDRVIHERKYTWRMPREIVEDAEAEGGMLSEFVEKVGGFVRKCVRAVFKWIGKILEQLFGRRPSKSGSSGYGWMVTQQMLLYTLVALTIVGLLFVLFRVVRARRRVPSVASEPVQSVVDLTSEDVNPEQLPVDGWSRLAQELLERGELRLALRALYLSSLASLAEQNLISVARFKSNRDYQRELQRRAHALPQVPALFEDNVSVFERIWYGMHDVDRDMVLHFAGNVQNLRAAGGAP